MAFVLRAVTDVRCEVKEAFQAAHGAWVNKEILYRNGVWIASYLSSEKGFIMPRGYVAGELTTYREHGGKDAFFYDGEPFQELEVEVIGNIYENPELISPEGA